MVGAGIGDVGNKAPCGVVIWVELAKVLVFVGGVGEGVGSCGW